MGRTLLGKAGTTLAGVAAIYLCVAYVLAPLVWKNAESGRPRVAMVTLTADNIPGDPINIGFEGSRDQILRVFHEAGWHPADPVTLRTSVEIGLSVMLDRPYEAAPVSSLYFEGRRQDLAFERPDGTSADRRHHARIWEVAARDDAAGKSWLGAATFDRGVELSRDTGEITHAIAADIDLERDSLVEQLEATGRVSSRHETEGVGPTQHGRNGEGNLYSTDGKAIVMLLAK